MSGSIKSQILQLLNYGFDLLFSNLVLKVRYETLGEVQRGKTNGLQTGSGLQFRFYAISVSRKLMTSSSTGCTGNTKQRCRAAIIASKGIDVSPLAAYTDKYTSSALAYIDGRLTCIVS